MMEEVNATQAAMLSGYSERTIRRKIASGMLPARRVASNRFAIRISDLPARHGPDALVERVAALEHRVLELERQVRLLSGLDLAQADSGEAGQDAAASLRDALLQLIEQAGNIGPLLSAPEAESAWEKRQQNPGCG